MEWRQLFSNEALLNLWLPVLVGVAVAAALFFLRLLLHKYIQRLAARTTTRFDDILIRYTRLPTLLWCFWLGIYAGFSLYQVHESWTDFTDQVIPVLFVAFGVYTVVSVLMAIFKWFKEEVCSKTASNMDNIIVSFMYLGTPLIGTALGTILILNMLGVNMEVVNNWLGAHGPKLAILTVVTITFQLLTIQVLPKIIDKAVHDARAEQSEEEMQKRTNTLVGVTVAAIQIALVFMFVLMVLTEIGINITAVLTGAGVVGIAVGFGAQSLVKDIIAGLFIILENQYRKGDIVTVAGQSGMVEDINLRRTILRDVEGTYHVIPNGQIGISSNQTKQMSRINLSLNVAYNTDLDRAMALINRVGKEMAEDPLWKEAILSPPRALRVDRLGDSGVEIRVRGETKPSRQWEVAGEFRLRIKKTFDDEGIEIPFPHTKIIFGNQPLNLAQSQKTEDRSRNQRTGTE